MICLPTQYIQVCTVKNTQAKVLYKQTGNNYTTILPSDLSKVDQLVVGFPQIEANTTEQVDLTVTMNRNIAKTTVKNTYKVSYATTNSQKRYCLILLSPW